MFNKHIPLAIFLFIAVLFPISTFSQTWKKIQEEAETEGSKANYVKALELCNKAVKEIEKDKKATRDDKLALNSDLGCYLVGTDKVGDGLKILMDIIEDIDKTPVTANTEIHIRSGYGTVLMVLGYFNDALGQFQKIYDFIKSNNYDKKELDKSDIVYNIGNLAQCYHKQYKFDKAEALYKESISFCEKENLTGTVDYPFQFTLLASLYTDMLYETRALGAYEDAQDAFVKNKDTLSPEYAVFILNYGTLMASTRQFEKALDLLYRSKSLTKNIYGENSEDYAVVLNNIGNTYSKMDRITETEQFYVQANKIKKNLANGRLDRYLNGVSNLLTFYNAVGRYDDAKDLAQELEKGLLNKKLEDTLSRAVFANNLAVVYQGQNDFAKAEKYYKEALLYYQSIYGLNNEFSADLYVDLGTIKFAAKKYEEGTEYLTKAATTFSTLTTLENKEGAALTLCNMVSVFINMDQGAAGESLINQALDMIKSNNITDPDILEQAYINKALVSGEMLKKDEAFEYLSKFLELKYSQIDKNFAYMTESEKLAFLEKFEISIKNFYASVFSFIDSSPDLIKVLLNFRLKTKSLLLNNVSKIKKKIIELNDPALNKKYDDLKVKRETISKLMSLNTEEYPGALSEVASLKTESDVLEKEISLKVTSYESMNKQNVFWKTIQKQLLPNEAAIELLQCNLLYKDRKEGTNYSFLIIKSTGDPSIVMFDRPLEWEEEVLTLYRTSINNKKDNPDLYRRLWKPVSEKLSGITHVYFSPDGIYNQINLNTLFNDDSKKYLLEEINVHYVTTLRDISEIKQHPSKKPLNAVLVGNPTFDYDLSKLQQNKQDFGEALAVRGTYGFVLPELPGTKTEVETIKTQLEKNSVSTVLLTEEKANEAAVKKIKNPDVLHFATHGFFLEDYPEESLAQLTKTEQTYYKNPMMRSGIFFSGSNKTYSINTSSIGHLKDFEDGMLTAYEAMNLNLDQTELVVLSACQTGLGKVKNGEGVFGLQRAFKLAGAKSIIMSYWPVSDDATMELMINFYNSWTATGDLYTAFKVAQQAVKKKYPEPYYWGAFVLNGR